MTKNFQVQIPDMSTLNDLHSLTLTYNVSKNLNVKWLNYNLTELTTAKTTLTNKACLQTTYRTNNKEFFTSSVTIFGDPAQKSHFKIKHYEIQNYAQRDYMDSNELAFNTLNPSIYFEYESFVNVKKSASIDQRWVMIGHLLVLRLKLSYLI